MGRTDIDRNLAISSGMEKIVIPDEVKLKAVKAVTGSDACRGAGDAKVILEAMGLYDFAITQVVIK